MKEVRKEGKKDKERNLRKSKETRWRVQIDEWMHGWMNGWMDGLMDG
jgi:hypothetical protein